MKTRSFIALASFAGLAHADTAINAHNHDSERAHDTLILDVSGYQFWDEQGSVHNETLEILVGFSGFGGCSVIGVAWDINLTTFTNPDSTFPSWASEATMTFQGIENVTVAAGVQNGVVNQNFRGSTEFLDPILIGNDNLLSIEFWETFDDAPGFADARFDEGSTLTLKGYCIPTPNICASFFLCGLFSSRRKR